ncbi:helix-turn-helix domain-containing protein [Thauera sinica]|uniref:Helix-turn-helix domain-containing protein n=1 Tax=Thauera sinica TaxID=2665146 RepID=A0ABW1AL92_9RHOO|nr:helix-turn-helix domain-containing protein [Thauera sp. K11]
MTGTELGEKLLASVRQMKAGQAARETRVALSPAVEARQKVGLSQAEFARLLGVSVRTLQDWEQGRREPSGAAKTLLRIAASNPAAVLAAVE